MTDIQPSLKPADVHGGCVVMHDRCPKCGDNIIMNKRLVECGARDCEHVLRQTTQEDLQWWESLKAARTTQPVAQGVDAPTIASLVYRALADAGALRGIK